LERNIQLVPYDKRVAEEAIFIGNESPGIFIRGDTCAGLRSSFWYFSHTFFTGILFRQKKVIRFIPYSGRIETGAVQFGNDFPGLFIRREEAILFCEELKNKHSNSDLLKKIKNIINRDVLGSRSAV